MTARSGFLLALVVVSSAIVLMLLAIVLTKAIRDSWARRRAELVAEVRPAVLAALDETPTGAPHALTGRRRAVAESIAVSLLPNLRGADRAALARLLDDNGVIARAIVGVYGGTSGRRQRAAELLGTAGHRPAVPHLLRLLDDRDPEVRNTAASALGRIGDARAVAALFVALDNRRVPAHVVSMAILRIGAVDPADVVGALGSPIARTRAIAAELAGSLGLGAARTHVERLLDDDSDDVRVSAARSLGRLASRSSTGLLIDRLERLLDDVGCSGDAGAGVDVRASCVDVAVAIVDALGQIGDRAAIPVLEASLMRRHRLSTAAAGALARMGRRRSFTSKDDRASGDRALEDRAAPSTSSGDPVIEVAVPSP